MSTVTDAPATTGARHGFDSLEEETHLDGLPVHGQLPPWLRGSLLRTGPAKWEVGDRTMNHWFDGLAMLHRFSFADGERLLREPLPGEPRLPRRPRPGRDRLLGVRHRSVPVPVRAGQRDVLARS